MINIMMILNDNDFTTQAKALADKHQEQAMKIRDTSKMAHDMSKSAYETGKKARKEQEEMFTKLSEMTANADEAIKLAMAVSKKVLKSEKMQQKIH